MTTFMNKNSSNKQTDTTLGVPWYLNVLVELFLTGRLL